MDYNNINTAAEILNAFRACNNNPENEIELFERLATRPEPPLDAFIDILRAIKLETLLALTIQAFGKITHPETKARIQESQELLELLSQKAESGSSDLIQWSAASAIEDIGFDFLMVAQYLSQDPKNIIERIVKSNSISSSSDSNEINRFWSYGPLEKPKKEAQKWRCVHTLTGHSERVCSLAISPDGQTLFSGGFDKTIKMWQVSTREELRTLTGHSELVCSLAISPDGQTLFSGSFDQTIKMWQVSTGKELRTLLIDRSPFVNSLPISPDGQTLFSVFFDRETINICQVSTGKELRSLIGHSERVCSLAISPDGQTLFSGCWDATIKMWQVSTGKELRSLIGHSQKVSFLGISPDGQTLFSGSVDKTIKIWQVSTGKELHTLTGTHWAF
ncbi:WD40 repeat domain-containing protein [Microcoleus sp. PH2017_40_RAT_O_B]|uniref:WD40 repeat domain-containing protein n=1 Tax=Microcoleus sp. PH2017_40_RAT_O_B TaxID=2798850 RepID=UPI0025FC0B1F|nr:WD40 repeat domain-containing protein [Microcoleus sp. PH2017_40_RAT_O_B]